MLIVDGGGGSLWVEVQISCSVELVEKGCDIDTVEVGLVRVEYVSTGTC